VDNRTLPSPKDIVMVQKLIEKTSTPTLPIKTSDDSSGVTNSSSSGVTTSSSGSSGNENDPSTSPVVLEKSGAAPAVLQNLEEFVVQTCTDISSLVKKESVVENEQVLSPKVEICLNSSTISLSKAMAYRAIASDKLQGVLKELSMEAEKLDATAKADEISEQDLCKCEQEQQREVEKYEALLKEARAKLEQVQSSRKQACQKLHQSKEVAAMQHKKIKLLKERHTSCVSELHSTVDTYTRISAKVSRGRLTDLTQQEVAYFLTEIGLVNYIPKFPVDGAALLLLIKPENKEDSQKELSARIPNLLDRKKLLHGEMVVRVTRKIHAPMPKSDPELNFASLSSREVTAWVQQRCSFRNPDVISRLYLPGYAALHITDSELAEGGVLEADRRVFLDEMTRITNSFIEYHAAQWVLHKREAHTELTCPLTNVPIKSACVERDGIIYEANALDGLSVSPMTNLPLPPPTPQLPYVSPTLSEILHPVN